ncbi:hypothetical protein ZTR_05252 [Talaromyces verruculosus]|nr:hypothetical protein ZTR_05252 [Talaromyces verruculosus]
MSSTEAGDGQNEYNEDMKHEKESYDILVNDGCRPLYSIDHFDDVTKNPEEHRDKLWLWRSYEGKWRVVRAMDDESWKMLIDSEILRPEETEEHINDITSAFQRQREESQAEESVESALSTIMSSQHAITNSRQSLSRSSIQASNSNTEPKFH